MKVLLQRVQSASVAVAGESISSIGPGLLLFVGFGHDDGPEVLRPMADKTVHLRIFPDDEGRMNRSLLQTRGDVLAVPQFTLYADTEKGRRPAFSQAMAAERAAALFERFLEFLRMTGVNRVGQGRFGTSMQVALVNDGPVTLMLET